MKNKYNLTFVPVTVLLLLLVSGCASTGRNMQQDKLTDNDVQVTLVSAAITGTEQNDGVLIREQIYYKLESENPLDSVSVRIDKHLLDETKTVIERVSRTVMVRSGINSSSYKFVVPAGSLIERTFLLQTEFSINGDRKLTVNQKVMPSNIADH